MKMQIQIFCTVLALLIASFAAESSFGGEAELVDQNWTQQMRKFKTALEGLIPLAASPRSFNNPENAVTIQAKIDSLSDVRKLLYHQKAVASSDPTIAYLATAFDDTISVINENLKNGRRDFARIGVLNITSFCIECHTHRKEGPEFFGASLSDLTSFLKPPERVEYLIAVRQFREALNIIEENLKAGQNKDFGLSTDRLVRYGLMISVRYNQDPDVTLRLVNEVEHAPDFPDFLAKDIESWRRSVKIWKKQKVPKMSETKKMIRFIEGRIQRGNEMCRQRNSSHAGDIEFLRAYALSTDLLKQKLSDKESAQVLMLMGDSHQDATDFLFWTLPRFYYEACIKVVPHSEQAQRCYDKYETELHQSYAPAWSMIPLDELEHLKELKELSVEPPKL